MDILKQDHGQANDPEQKFVQLPDKFCFQALSERPALQARMDVLIPHTFGLLPCVNNPNSRRCADAERYLEPAAAAWHIVSGFAGHDVLWTMNASTKTTDQIDRLKASHQCQPKPQGL